MRLLGFNLTREKAAIGSAVPADRSTAWRTVSEPFTGAWQRNIEVKYDEVVAFHAVFACQTLIASDIAKLRVKLVQQTEGIWSETANPAFSPVLRKPNGYQTRIQFWESYMLSKLSRGNTYVLKVRDARNVVTALHVLDPQRVTPLVSDSGEVFYSLKRDDLSGVASEVAVPAREIIHDRWNCLHHPLVGLSPIYACGLAATQGLKIQNNATTFFANGSRPGGIVTVPGRITQEQLEVLKQTWSASYSGENAGKVAVLSDGMTYSPGAVTPDDAQLIEQLKLTAEIVCSAFHVPPYKLGLGNMPANTNVQSLNVEYYSQCLQALIEAAELCLDEGLGIGEEYKLGTEFDLDNLLRMDSVTQMEVVERSKNVLTLDERRRKLDAPKITGGGTVYMQEQDHSIEAIAARDALLIDQAAAQPQAEPPAANDNAEEQARQARALLALYEKDLREALNA